MDKIARVAPPEAVSVSDGLYSFVVKLNEAPAGHWIYVFRLVVSFPHQLALETLEAPGQRVEIGLGHGAPPSTVWDDQTSATTATVSRPGEDGGPRDRRPFPTSERRRARRIPRGAGR